MKKLCKLLLKVSGLLIFSGMFLFLGCAHDVRPPVASLDNPEHHVFNGLKLLDTGQYDGAQREFKLALELDPKYSSAHYGMGLVQGYNGDFKSAFASMKSAKKYSQEKRDKAMSYVGFMRFYLLQKEKGWLKDVEKNFDKSTGILEDLPDAHFYMGIAYKDANRYGSAGDAFKKVLSVDKNLVEEADKQLEHVQKIERALPGTEVGKKLALQEKITRADVAAIFVHELRLEKVFKKGKANTAVVEMPRDINDHPLKTDIETIINLGVKGIETAPNENFYPNKYVIRAVYAMMIEDIIATITHDKELSLKYIGYPSPFPDLRSDSPYFNAVMVCTSRGIMEAENIMTGEFNPSGPITGSDALLVIRKLREELRIF